MATFTRNLIFVITFINGCWGLTEEFQNNFCFHGNADFDIYDVAFDNCLDACRAREICSGVTMNWILNYCRLHLGSDVTQMECPASGFLYSGKPAWRQKQFDGCDCGPQMTCDKDTGHCGITECSLPGQIEYGQVLGNQRFIGAKIAFLCNHGYEPIAASSTCLETGVWSGLGRCVKVCPNGAPTGTFTNIPEVTAVFPGSIIQYGCQTGYEITSQEDLTLTCSEEGQWGSPPVCWSRCADTAPPGTNTVDPAVDSRLPGTVITYTCTSGHIPLGGMTMNLTCAINGSWGIPPSCEIACAATAPTGTNTVDPAVENRLPGTVITYTCTSGYIPQNGMTMNITCSSIGSWETPPTCVIACAATAPPGTNTVDPAVDNRLPGTVIRYTCTSGYIPQNGMTMSITCSTSGSWGTPPTCVIACAATAPPGTNTVDPAVEIRLPGTVIRYTCTSGYIPQNGMTMSITCSTSGSWGTPPTCVIACAATAPPGTNTVDPAVEIRLPGTVIRYTCTSGYIPQSGMTMSVTCSTTGTWGTAPTCVIACAATAPPGTNTVDPAVGNRLPGTVITYTCTSGHIPHNGMTMSLTCSNTGSWGTAPTCVIACAATAPPGTNTVDPAVDDRLPGTVITYTCISGYIPHNGMAMSITCSISGTWGTAPTCVIACAATAPPGTNTVDPAVANRLPGTMITYTCTSGYIPKNGMTMSITCSISGTWGTAPTCVIACAATAPPGINTVDPAVENRLPGTVITYTCISGYIPQDGTTMNLMCSNTGSWGTPPTCDIEPPCETGWYFIGGRCLTFVTTPATWSASQIYCEQLGGDLAHIYSYEDFLDVKALISNEWPLSAGHPWIGFNDLSEEGVFQSASGDDVPTYVRNQLVSTNSDDNDCAYYVLTYQELRMFGCSYTDASICEK